MSADWLGNGVEGTNFAFGSMEKMKKEKKNLWLICKYRCIQSVCQCSKINKYVLFMKLNIHIGTP